MTQTKWHFDLNPNIGMLDKTIRYSVSAALICVTLFAAPPTMGWLVLLPLAAIPIFTSAFVGWDPFYAIFQKHLGAKV